MNYFKTVTLGAFTWKDEDRVAALFAGIRELGGIWIVLHFFLLSLCLNFPVMFAIARLSPAELFGRVLGQGEAAQNALAAAGNSYGTTVLLPLLGMALVLVLIIQAVFYLCAAFCLGLSRLNVSAISFRDRWGLAVFSSTLPALASSLFGLALPTVHIIVFYFIVIFLIFQRSRLCPHG